MTKTLPAVLPLDLKRAGFVSRSITAPPAATANLPASRSVPCRRRRRLNGGQSWTRVGCTDGD